MFIVLIYDHRYIPGRSVFTESLFTVYRGIGDSSYSTPAEDDEITIELMARDLLFLLQSLKFSEVALCGYSMGGQSLTQSSQDPGMKGSLTLSI